ncbi:hypothetical protein M8494_27505 [Serratia ureilytica]
MGGTADNGLGAELLYSRPAWPGYRDNNDNTDIDDFMLKTRYAFQRSRRAAGQFPLLRRQSRHAGRAECRAIRAKPVPIHAAVGPVRKVVARICRSSTKHQEDDKQFEVLTYFTDSYRGSNIESKAPAKTRASGAWSPIRVTIQPGLSSQASSQVFRFWDMAHEITSRLPLPE